MLVCPSSGDGGGNTTDGKSPQCKHPHLSRWNYKTKNCLNVFVLLSLYKMKLPQLVASGNTRMCTLHHDVLHSQWQRSDKVMLPDVSHWNCKNRVLGQVKSSYFHYRHPWQFVYRALADNGILLLLLDCSHSLIFLIICSTMVSIPLKGGILSPSTCVWVQLVQEISAQKRHFSFLVVAGLPRCICATNYSCRVAFGEAHKLSLSMW